MNCGFELIIPLKYDITYVDNYLILLEPILREIKLSKSRQLSGSILLDELHSPIYAIYEIKQEVRSILGLHGKEDHRYKFVPEDVNFCVGKIKLWLFKSGISFITINIIKCSWRISFTIYINSVIIRDIIFS